MNLRGLGSGWLAMILMMAWSQPGVSATLEIYVAPYGNDGNDGTRSKPFATLERARDEIRQLRQRQKWQNGAVTVWLRGGDYLRTNALELTAEDSGRPASPIIWRRYKDETVRLLGGKALSGFKPVSDPGILARFEEGARAHIQELDLRALGITEYGELKSRGFGRPTTPAQGELFFGGRPMTLARWPNEGSFAKIAGVPESGATKDEHGGSLGKLEEGFLCKNDRLQGWKESPDIWVHGYWAWDWANSYERVASLDRERGLIQTAAPYGLYGFRKGQRFYFLNVLEELDQPGEWFLDRVQGRLYFWPPESKETTDRAKTKRDPKFGPGKDEILFSICDQPLVRLVGVSNLSFQGLILEATRGHGVEMRGGASNRIAGCVIRNIGNSAVSIDGGTGNGVQSCDIFDTGDAGVELNGGDRQRLVAGGHFVENCHFARQGRWSKCYVPAVLMNGVGMRASHNLIHDHPHCAILFNGNDHLIEFNEIHHIALETGDVGAIYAGRDYTYRGNRIRNNFIHHTGGVGMGSMGVYMDDCVSGTEIYGNIFYKVQRAAFLGGGCDHQVVNNIFVECNHAVELDGRGLDTSPVWRGMVNETMRNRLADVPLELYREHYPAMKVLDEFYGAPGGSAIQGAAFKGVPPLNNLVAQNICVGKWLNIYWHARPGMLRIENNLTNAAALFRTPPGDHTAATGFALKPGSPVEKAGFKPIPAEKIGLQTDAFRRGAYL